MITNWATILENWFGPYLPKRINESIKFWCHVWPLRSPLNNTRVPTVLSYSFLHFYALLEKNKTSPLASKFLKIPEEEPTSSTVT